MRFVSAALSAAVLVCGLAGAGPSLAAPASDAAVAIQQVSDRWDRDGRRGWDRPHHRRYGRHDQRRRDWGHRRGHQWGYHRPQRRCHTEYVFEFGPYGARWIPIERCYRGW